MTETTNKIICPACGSGNFDSRVDERQLNFPYVGMLGVEEVINTCLICGTEGDFARINDGAIEAVIEEAKRIGSENMLSYLTTHGHSMAYMERALDLPQRTMMRWKLGECTASSLTLLRIVRTFPWILKVAEEKFDSIKSVQILCAEGLRAAGNMLASISPAMRIEVTVDSKKADEVTFTGTASVIKNVDYTQLQNIRVVGGPQ